MPYSASWQVTRVALTRLCFGLLGGGLFAAAAGLPASVARAAPADPLVAQDAGTWDMTFEAGNRRCRINLTSNGAPGGGYEIVMPAGCHRAFPKLATVKSWMPREGEHVVFQSDAGQPVIDFGPSGGPSLSAIASETDVYGLMPTDQARQAALSIVRPDGTGAVTPPAEAPVAEASAADAAAPPAAKHFAATSVRVVTTAEAAGGYAVVRKGKDTGCMVTLDNKAKGPKATLKAKLAPSCRDQGIVIFDPVGWQIVKGQLVLTAKRGHTTELSLQDDDTWANSGAPGGRALVLKRL